MCGIFASNDPTVSNTEHASIIEKRLQFRGPDGSSGIIKINNWLTLHTRLAIIDLSPASRQPFINEDLSQLVFNGEILNYKELGYRYFNKEYNSDVKLLNDLICHDRLKLTELDGFFSFIFIDGNGTLRYACRDKFGVKPLFYFQAKDGVYSFSSEPSVLADIYELDVNSDAVDEYRAFRYPLFARSFYNGINEVPAGHCIVHGKYFDIEQELNCDISPCTDLELKQTLMHAINTRCVADTPIGLLLSRGIDSNLIKELKAFDQYYSVGFSWDEDIKYLEDLNDEKVTIVTVTEEEFSEAFEYLLDLRGEPMSVPNEVLLFIVGKRAARDGVKVLLSGEGADEFFGGYDRIFRWALTTDNFQIEEFASKYCYTSVRENETILQKLGALFEQHQFDTVFEKVRWFFIKYHMPILFRRLDFALMAAGVEGREPLANGHVFNVAKNYTGVDLMNSKVGKMPLRRIAQITLGAEFAFAQKVGFPVQLNRIFPEYKTKSNYEIWFEKNLEVLT